MKKTAFLTILALALTGCASSSGVVRAGPDTFTVNTSASHGAGGMGAAKKAAYTEASQACAANSKKIDVVRENTTHPSWNDGMYNVDLVFRCI
jgi:uncharacterized protein YcfL